MYSFVFNPDSKTLSQPIPSPILPLFQQQNGIPTQNTMMQVDNTKSTKMIP